MPVGNNRVCAGLRRDPVVLKDWEQPEVINTDKAPPYAAALAELKAEGKCPQDTQHRQVKYLNNIVEADHGKLRQLIRLCAVSSR